MLFPLAAQSVAEGQTIVRIRGELLVFLSVATAALDGFRWAFGMGIVSENAGDVGVTAVPSPIVDIAWDGWMVYETGHCTGWDILPATGNNANAGSSMVRITIDSKAMRKFRFSDILMPVFAATDEVGAAVIQANLSSRVLVKLP